MNARPIVAALLVLCTTVTGSIFAWAADPPPPPPPPAAGAVPPAPAGQVQGQSELTPPRLSYVHGDEVSFWRPGTEDWTPARVNTPLAPGDVLYAGRATTIEIQVGPRAFLRAAEGTQIGLDDQDDDLVQFRVTAGHVGVDVREMPQGQTLELATPNAAFTVDRAGYYRLDVGDDSTTFRAHRAGRAGVVPANGNSAIVTANQQVVVSGSDGARVQIIAAPELTAWDRWNDQRTDALAQSASVRYVGTGVYGAEQLDRHGSWRAVETYGNVWVPSGVPAGWSPYTTGRWIWDPRFGWTWLDDAAWGWAPYHYGRWVYVSNYWAWAPGPIVVRPVYAPALVVFLGGPVRVSIGRPLAWAPLAWGEPVIPWWGRPGFVGRPYWGGWGGPRVVNNVVVNQTTVNVTNINVYRNVNVTNAVVGVPAERFGHGHVRPVRLERDDVRQLSLVRGGLDARPVAASMTPATGRAVRPPDAVKSRPVVATRAPRDYAPMLRAQGLEPERANAPAAAPRAVHVKGAPGRERAAEPAQPGRSGGERPGRPEPDQAKAPGAERQIPTAPGTPSAPGAPAMGKGRDDDGQRPERGDRGGRLGQGKDDQPTTQPDRRARQTPPPVPQPVPQAPAPRDARPEPKDDRSAIPNDPPDRRGRQTPPPAPQAPAPRDARPEPKDDRSAIPNDPPVRRQDQQQRQQRQEQQRQEQQRQVKPPQPPQPQPQVVPQAPPPPRGERPDRREERQQPQQRQVSPPQPPQPQPQVGPQAPPPPRGERSDQKEERQQQQRQARPPQPAPPQPQPQVMPQAPPKGEARPQQREERQPPPQRQEQRGRPDKDRSERPEPRAERERANPRVEAPAAPAPRQERAERVAPGPRIGNSQTPPAARPAPAPAIEQRGERPAGRGQDREPGSPRPRGRGDG